MIWLIDKLRKRGVHVSGISRRVALLDGRMLAVDGIWRLHGAFLFVYGLMGFADLTSLDESLDGSLDLVTTYIHKLGSFFI